MGYRIREIREAKKMTQEELAKKSGISRQTIHALECGKSVSKVNTLMAIAVALGVTIDELFLGKAV